MTFWRAMMMKLHCKYTVALFILTFFTFAAPFAFGQLPPNAKERVNNLKRVRLSDILGLRGSEADNFFAKYDQLQMKVDAARNTLREAVAELERATQKKSEDINKKGETVFEKQDAYNNTIADKIRALKPLLTDEQYAKLIIFEHNFPLHLQKMLIKRAKKYREANGEE